MELVRLSQETILEGFDCGTDFMNILKGMLNTNPIYSAFRYLTVDAYLSAIDFYKKNNFKELSEKITNEHTRLMFFDMMELE